MAYLMCKEYSSKLGQELLHSKISSDVVLVTDKSEKVIFAHKCILAVASQYLKVLLASEVQAPRDGAEAIDGVACIQEINLESIPFEMLDLLIRFIYTGELRFDDHNVFELVVHANNLVLSEAEELCWEHMLSTLNVQTVYRVYVQAEKSKRPKEIEEAMSFLLSNFIKFARTRDFLLMDVNLLCLLIKSSRLRVESEEDVFHVVRSWINHCSEERNAFFLRLLSYIRLPLLTSKFMADIIYPHCVCDQTKDYVKDGLSWHSLGAASDRSGLISQNANPRSTA